MKGHRAIDSVLLKELKSCRAKEHGALPRETGLKLMLDSASAEEPSGVSGKGRDAAVEELWGLTSFFGYGTDTFVLAVSLLDRFLAIMKVRPKHLPCVGVCCLHMASKGAEEESNVSPSHELIRISHGKFTVSDLCRMEKIVSEKLSVEPRGVTALTFLRLYHSALADPSRPASPDDIPSITRLEAQLKACLCRMVFSKAKPSVLALSLIAQDSNAPQSIILKMVQQFQKHLKISNKELLHWKELVTKRMTEYHSGECVKPDNKKLVWIVSRRTAQNLQALHFRVPGLPTIPEGGWDESESEDSNEESSCGEDSPCGSPGSDGEGPFFTSIVAKYRK